MSYYPKRKKAKRAFEALFRKGKRLGDIRTPISRANLRELMIAYYCPIVCDGVVRGEGWHKTCEAAADAALDTLEGRLPTKVHLDPVIGDDSSLGPRSPFEAPTAEERAEIKATLDARK